MEASEIEAALATIDRVIADSERTGQRWFVEWFFTWIGRNRKLAKDFKATINRFSQICRRLAKASTTRASLLMPTTRPFGMFLG